MAQKDLSGAVDSLLLALDGNAAALAAVGTSGALPTMDFSRPNGCYHGKLTRQETEQRLRGLPDGYFLIRDSSTAPGDLVLSVSESNRVSHYIISKRGSQFIIGDQRFTMMAVLLEFYKTHILDTSVLTEPVMLPAYNAAAVQQTLQAAANLAQLQTSAAAPPPVAPAPVQAPPPVIASTPPPVAPSPVVPPVVAAPPPAAAPPPVVATPPPAVTPSPVTRAMSTSSVTEDAAAAAAAVSALKFETPRSSVAMPSSDAGGPPMPGVLAKARTLYDFASDDAEDLSFVKGALLYIFEKTDMNWWQAKDLEGNAGCIPGNYVQIIESFSPEFPASEVKAEVASRTASNVSQTSNAGAGASVSSGGGGGGRASNGVGGVTLSSSGQVKFKPTVQPGNESVKKLVKIFSQDNQVKAVLLSPNLHMCYNVIVAALSKFKADGPHELMQIAPDGTEVCIDEAADVREVVALWGVREKDYKLQLRKSANVSVGMETVVAIQEFSSAFDESALCFQKGDRITVLSKDSSGTWVGECNGRQGKFPMTYVERE